MARKSRSSTDTLTLKDVVQKQGAEFEFHALVKLLEYFSRKSRSIGESAYPSQESARFRARVSMEFAQSDIAQVVLPKKGSTIPPLVETNFMGIAGAQGPLPIPYTQQLLNQVAVHDTSMRDFLDIFNHRLLSILHRVRKTYWVGVSSANPEDTALGLVLRSFIAENAWVNECDLHIRSLLSMALCFWQRPRSADQLRLILSIFLRTEVRLHMFEGGWKKAPITQQTCLGPKGRYQSLGRDFVLGKRFWDTSHQFTIIVGPIGLREYYKMLRSTKTFKALVHIVHSFAGSYQQFRVRLHWRADEKPQWRLGSDCALGSTTWLWTDQKKVWDTQTVITQRVGDR